MYRCAGGLVSLSDMMAAAYPHVSRHGSRDIRLDEGRAATQEFD